MEIVNVLVTETVESVDITVINSFEEITVTVSEAVAGLSAYQIAVQHGYTGTEEEWINTLSFTTWTAAMFTTGIKTTGVDAGLLNQQSITDDYLYHCVKGGDATVAIWKKTLLFQTI